MTHAYCSFSYIQGGSYMTGTNLYVNKCIQSRSYLNHLVYSRYTLCSSSTVITRKSKVHLLLHTELSRVPPCLLTVHGHFRRLFATSRILHIVYEVSISRRQAKRLIYSTIMLSPSWEETLFYNLIQWPTWYTLALLYNTFIIILYMFRALYAHRQEVKLYWRSIWYRHSQ